MMNIALIGPSGAGKGTLASKLVSTFEMLAVDTGDLLREKLENRMAVGILAQKYMTRGELVPDELVDAMMEEWLWRADSKKNILFDGFPRTVSQAQFVDKFFKEINRTLRAVIYLKVSDEAVIRRLSGRVVCRTCQKPYHLEFKPPVKERVCDECGGQLYQRPDDIPELVRVRLRAFHRVTGPVVTYYQQTGRLIIAEGEGEIDEVQAAVVDTVAAVHRQESRLATREEAERIQAFSSDITLAPEHAAEPSFDVVLVGGPGSGKGTQAEQLSNCFNLPHIATGDLFREHLDQETALGLSAKVYMDRGELVPDDVTEAMVEERLSRPDTVEGFILDGFPRTLPQAEALTEIVTALRRQIDAVVYIKVSDSEIVSRLSGRLICRRCQTPYHSEFKPPAKEGICDICQGELYWRDDDNPDIIGARLKTYHSHTAPLINYYREAGLLIEIDGEGDVSQVTQRALSAVKAISES